MAAGQPPSAPGVRAFLTYKRQRRELASALDGSGRGLSNIERGSGSRFLHPARVQSAVNQVALSAREPFRYWHSNLHRMLRRHCLITNLHIYLAL